MPLSSPLPHDAQPTVSSDSAFLFVPLPSDLNCGNSLNPVMLIMCPFRRFRIPGRTVRIILAVPKKFTSNCSRKFQSLISSNAPTKATLVKHTAESLFEAVLTTTSICPNFSSASAMDDWHSHICRTSHSISAHVSGYSVARDCY
jgi:hypothetical protein